MARPRPGPLAGILVADCSTVLAGPLCTMLLGDLGADVVKVEPPAGDATRGWGPPWVGGDPAGSSERTAAYYLAVNRNKRSIRLDLKRPEGRDVLARLLRRADVLVENARVGGFAALGFDDDTLAQLNPRLVHLAISGYGPIGPDASKPGYDFVAQAVGGLMSITGLPAAEGGRPTKVGVAVSDVVSGLFGCVAVLAALLGRERATSSAAGRGQRIDVSLLEATLAMLVNQAQNAFATGVPPVRQGNAHPNIVPYESFATADGEIAVGVGSERQWPRFCEAIGLPELTDDPRFRSNGDRVANRDALRPLLADRFRATTTDVWMRRLDAADVPAGPIHDVVAALGSPQATALGMVEAVEHPAWGLVRQVRAPFTLSETPSAIRSAPPALGEHADEILSELGLDPEAIARLRAEGVV